MAGARPPKLRALVRALTWSFDTFFNTCHLFIISHFHWKVMPGNNPEGTLLRKLDIRPRRTITDLVPYPIFSYPIEESATVCS